MLLRFFDHFVKGLPNHFEETPRITLIHEATALNRMVVSPAGNSSGGGAWTTTLDGWNQSVRLLRLHLHGDGLMDLHKPRGGSNADRYLFPEPTVEVPGAWKGSAEKDGHMSATTPALAQDLEVFGPASADLWIESTARDADSQVTVSEVRSDGQEMYVQNGWLRLSQRALDPARSTPLRPYQTHLKGDVEPLNPRHPGQRSDRDLSFRSRLPQRLGDPADRRYTLATAARAHPRNQRD